MNPNGLHLNRQRNIENYGGKQVGREINIQVRKLLKFLSWLVSQKSQKKQVQLATLMHTEPVRSFCTKSDTNRLNRRIKLLCLVQFVYVYMCVWLYV